MGIEPGKSFKDQNLLSDGSFPGDNGTPTPIAAGAMLEREEDPDSQDPFDDPFNQP